MSQIYLFALFGSSIGVVVFAYLFGSYPCCGGGLLLLWL